MTAQEFYEWRLDQLPGGGHGQAVRMWDRLLAEGNRRYEETEKESRQVYDVWEKKMKEDSQRTAQEFFSSARRVGSVCEESRGFVEAP